MLNTLHRRCLWLTDTIPSWAPTLGECWLASHRAIIVSDDEELTEATGIEVVGRAQVKQLLGQTLDAMLVDIRQGLSLSMLSLLAGCVRGGGVFAIYSGEPRDWLCAPDDCLDKQLSYPITSTASAQSYKTLFLAALSDGTFSELAKLNPHQRLTAFSPVEVNPACDHIELTPAQSQTIGRLEHQPVSLLIAPRGRGKSTLIGKAIDLFQQQGKHVALCASSQQQVITAKNTFHSNQAFPFYAPDALLVGNNTFDLLIVDEAASIPVPILIALQRRAKHCLFSTTNDGYEGSGKGFGIKFKQYLSEQSLPFQTLELSQPIRWGENDPLEQWLNQLLFSAYDSPKKAPSVNVTTTDISLRFLSLAGKDWLSYPRLLDQAFALLVNAHYQTTPDNKRWLVDDPSNRTILLSSSELNDNGQPQVYGVALILDEGPIEAGLATLIEQGSRRPRGHLFPQSMLAHCGFSNAGEFRFWRISRIAMADEWQRHGLGSQLIAQTEKEARIRQLDSLCTSFAYDPQVLRFWQKQGFFTVRLGTSLDKATGTYSVMMVKPLNNKTLIALAQWSVEFRHFLKAAKEIGLYTLSAEDLLPIENSLIATQGEQSHSLSPQTHQRLAHHLALFAHHARPLATILPWLRIALSLPGYLGKPKVDYPLLNKVANGEITEQNCQYHGFHGKKAFIKTIREQVGLAITP